jgi:hypothetical protein
MDNVDRASIEAAARKFGLRVPPQDMQRGIDPQADAIEDAARRFGCHLPPRGQWRNSIEAVRFGKIPGWN